MRRFPPFLRATATLLLPLAVAAAPEGARAPEGQAPAPAEAPAVIHYGVLYEVEVLPSARAARVAIRLDSDSWMVKRIRLRIDPERQRDFRGDGKIERQENAVVWFPPRNGGVLRYEFDIDHLRDSRSYDARCGESWSLFRGDDLVPPARVLTEDGAHSRARLRLRLPAGWSAAVPYARSADGTYEVDYAHRRFDRPTGWFVLGRLGVLRERISGTSVAVAGPRNQGVRRHDILALLRWTLPALRDAIGSLPKRLLVVGAGDPMWRGGLSGPRSVYIHADRPLLSSDGTSPILHELVHTALAVRPGPGGDWIVEGLAELYSLEILVRSKTISRRRFRRSIERLVERGQKAPALEVDRSRGAVTARAVGVLHALDEELRSGSEDAISLDDVVARLAEAGGKVTTESFQGLVEEVSGRSFAAFFRSHSLARRGG